MHQACFSAYRQGFSVISRGLLASCAQLGFIRLLKRILFDDELGGSLIRLIFLGLPTVFSSWPEIGLKGRIP